MTWPETLSKAAQRRSISDATSRSRNIRLLIHSVRQSMRTTGLPQAASAAVRASRRLDGLPALPAPRPVLGDPRLHFAVEGFRGGDVGAERTRPLGQFFRKAALARSRAAEHQSDLPHGFTGGMRAMKCPRMRSGQWRNGTSPVSALAMGCEPVEDGIGLGAARFMVAGEIGEALDHRAGSRCNGACSSTGRPASAARQRPCRGPRAPPTCAQSVSRRRSARRVRSSRPPNSGRWYT